ncbi:hypothetical protein C4565_07770 [Candidatus Parcubacteria bacterium]|nr:MAG: hypothetical protein C4565_07770 [Candidatus Parcubacteria bacterium]
MNKIPLTTKVYVWSVVFEPLLFFVVWERQIAGIGGNISRILQGFVITVLILKYFITSSDLRINNLSSPLYRNYYIYLVIVILAGFVGMASGVYSLSGTYSGEGQSFFSNLLNSPFVRPLFEYVIAIYYFIYFVVLPRYMLKTERAVIYFFSLFKRMFVISLVVGMVDLAFNVVGINLVPRHIADWRHVGVRFHGLAGEPRDAFVYLFLGLAILKLDTYIKGQSLNKLWVFAIISAALLTQSASGLIGIAVFLVMFTMYSLAHSMNTRKFILLCTILTLTPVLIYGAIMSSARLLLYWESMSDLWYLLESGGELPYVLMVQSPNIYPIYDLIVKVRELNILPIIIGSGLGSSSAINNHYASFAGEMINPNSQLVRSIFESGIIGTFFFIMSFIHPVKQVTKYFPAKDRYTFIIINLLLIGCFMGHRSVAPFIFLGIFLAVFRPYRCYRHNEENKASGIIPNSQINCGATV